MSSASSAPCWWHAFPVLRDVEDPQWRAVMSQARVLSIPAGTFVFRAGDACHNYLFLLDGSLRVEKIGENGREIVLYRVGPGETCLLTTSCLIAKTPYPAEGVTETATRAAALTGSQFQDALAINATFRTFVFASFGARLTELMLLVDAITFGHGDVRLARRLLEWGGPSGEVTVTHQQLAAELGTAREVVSRLLKDFEHRGYLRLGRGRVVITDREGLQARAKAL